MIVPLYFIFSLLFSCITAQTPGVQELYRFPRGTGISNVLVLRNESLLFTLFTEPSLYRLDPKSSKSKPVLVHRFPGYTSLFDIAQVNKYEIALIAGNVIDGTVRDFDSSVPGSFSVFLLSLSGQILKSFSVPEAGSFQSITTLPQSPQYILLSDGTSVIIWRLNIRTGAADPVLTINDLLSADERKPLLHGIQVQDDYLYFTDADLPGIKRLRITPDGRLAAGFPEGRLIFREYEYYDFAIRLDRSIYYTNIYENTVNYFSPFGPPYNTFKGTDGFLSYQQGVVHPTGLAFSDNAPRCNILYVVTAGNLPYDPDYIPQNIGGQVLKVDLSQVIPFSLYNDYNTSCIKKA